MKRTQIFIVLAFLLTGAYLLQAGGYFYAVGGVGTHVGWRFAFALTLFFIAALAGSVLPQWRFPIILFLSLLHLYVQYRPLKTTVALAIWIAFYALVQLRMSWWLKVVPMIALYAAPFLLVTFDPTSALNGALTVAFCASNFALRSVLYAYEATMKRGLVTEAGLPGYLLCLVAAPLTMVSFAPIGFLVLLRGLRREDDPGMLSRGVREIALGVAFLTARQLGSMTGILPDYDRVLDAAEHLDALTALAACHLFFLKFFLRVAGDVHLAVGMLRMLGFDIAPGTERPYLSRNILEYWRRWNTYYRDYLMTLGYYPVAAALKRRPLLAAAAGGAAAFVLSGSAHVLYHYLRHPRDITLQRVLDEHVWALVFGAFVVAGMIREAKLRGRGRATVHGQPQADWLKGLREAGAIVVTITTVSVILLLNYPRLPDTPLASVFEIVRAFFRVPW